MLRWRIVGPGLPDLFLMAESFDEALAKARMRNPNYCGGYVEDDD